MCLPEQERKALYDAGPADYPHEAFVDGYAQASNLNALAVGNQTVRIKKGRGSK